MARYNLQVLVTAANIAQVRKMLAAHDVTGQIDKVKLSPSRSDRFSDCEDLVNDARSELESLKEELEAWKDSMPENLQDGSKASELDDAISDLDELINNLDSCRWEVSFPGMF